MEKRFVLTPGEVAKISRGLTIKAIPVFIIDEYTGEKRIRTVVKEITEKVYQTPVKGKIYRYSFKSNYENIPCWLEIKWTNKTMRWEIEFEENIPNEFLEKENISGWDILK